MKYNKPNKKGILDSLLILILLFVFCMISLFGVKVMNDINSNLQSNTQISEQAKTVVNTGTVAMPKIINGLFLFVMIGSAIGAGLLAYFIRSSPVFLVVFLVVGLIIFGLSFIFSNMYYGMSTDTALASTAEQLDIIGFGMLNMPYFVLAIVLIVSIVTYIKGGENG